MELGATDFVLTGNKNFSDAWKGKLDLIIVNLLSCIYLRVLISYSAQRMCPREFLKGILYRLSNFKVALSW